ncbi:hypothetical protein H6503_02150 [Candidatus Woesearchaeota archaeon]|nr:hypothetical protein [Candidatus Woesearchaeota archaeon]
MASKDFNLSMDDYISTRRDKKSLFFETKKRNDEMDDEVPSGVSSDSVYIIKKPKTFWNKLMEKFSGTEEEDFQERSKEESVEVSKESEQVFEQEYDEIKQEEKKGFLSWLSGIFSSKVNETYEDIDQQEMLEEKSTFDGADIQRDSEQMTLEQTQEPEAEKKGLWESILSFFGLGIDKEDDGESDEENVQESIEKINTSEELESMKKDFKEIAVISTAAFKKLPKEQFELFKKSSDFAKFKEILKKHEIIREK